MSRIRRKEFLGLLSAGVAAASCGGRPREPLRDPELPGPGGTKAADDEAYWATVRECYDLPASHINLENGYFSVCALPVIREHRSRQAYINRRGAHYMRTERQEAHERVRERLAAFSGVDPEELAIVRNTTEALNIVLRGIDYQPGDEIIMSNQDYGSMAGILRRLAQRRGVVLRVVDLPLDPTSPRQVVDAYSAEVTPKTRLCLVTYVIHVTGHVLPAAEICTRMRQAGVETVVDAAHAFGQLPFEIPELECDYVGASLHKWLGAPLGNGLLWMRRAHIPEIEPLFADLDQESTNIRRFEHVGTRPMHDLEAIEYAIEFHQRLGAQAKRDRLLYLRQSWVTSAREIPKVRILSPSGDPSSCAIATVAVDGLTPDRLADELWDAGIYSVAIKHPVIEGVRITPHVYSTRSEVDGLVSALRSIGAAA